MLKAMREWFAEYTIKVRGDECLQNDNTETALSIIQEKFSELHSQQNKICELLEKGVYTVEMFSKRNGVLEKEIRKL